MGEGVRALSGSEGDMAWAVMARLRTTMTRAVCTHKMFVSLWLLQMPLPQRERPCR